MASEKLVLAVIRAARPTFRNQNDKIAFAVHSSFLTSGYVLTATGPQALSDNAFSDPSNDEVSVDHWNELNDEYAFVYANPEKGSEKVLVKCLVMNDKLLVHAFTQGSSEPLSLEIDVGDYAGEDGVSNYSQQFKNLDKLVKKIDGDILSKLDGSAKASSSSRSSETSNRTRQEIPDPVAGFGEPGGPPTQGVPPGARFDPYGPPGVPGFEPNRFARNPRRPGYDTHPDWQHFRRDADSDYI
ncbi:hypothetical protein JHK85_024702 [Glycine max]|nr:hypothetical protein JHK85_024702 [Glycine max]